MRDEGVVGVHLHLQTAGPPSNLGAHLAQADDAQHLVAHLNSHERAPPPLAAAEGLVGLRNVAGQRHHQRNGMLCCGNGVARWSVDHRYALAGRRLKIDVVNAHSGASNHLEFLSGLNDLRSSLGLAPDHERFVVPDNREQLLGVQSQLNVHFAHGTEHLDSQGVNGVGN